MLKLKEIMQSTDDLICEGENQKRVLLSIDMQNAAPGTVADGDALEYFRVNKDLRAEFTTAEIDTCTFVFLISTKNVVYQSDSVIKLSFVLN